MNLLSRVTRGPWLLATSNSWRRFVSRDGAPVCEPITYSERDRHPDLHFKNGGEDGPDAQLLAASYDHALTLAAILANHASFVRRPEDKTIIEFSAGKAGNWHGWTVLKLDAFGAPILTDELRGELERLLGMNS